MQTSKPMEFPPDPEADPNVVEEEKTIEYVHFRKNSHNEWEEASEFLWRIPEDELAIVYGATCIRLDAMAEAEANLVNYHHPEPLRIAGKTKTVEITHALEVLKRPLLANMKHATGTPEAVIELGGILQKSTQWWLKKEVGLQALSSIGWLMDVSKARPPALNKDDSATDYEESLFPKNLIVTEENAPSGYNDRQIALLKKTKGIAAEVLAPCGNTGKEYAEMGIVAFGQKVFKTYSRLFTCLPDPEEKERERFEQMRAAAAEKRAMSGE